MYIYIYIYKIIAINPKRYTGIRNISYHWPNRYNLQYDIDFLGCWCSSLVLILQSYGIKVGYGGIQDHEEAEMVVLLKVEAAAVEVWDLICQTESILSSVYLFFLILPFFLFFPFYGSECYDFPPPPPSFATCPIIHPFSKYEIFV